MGFPTFKHRKPLAGVQNFITLFFFFLICFYFCCSCCFCFVPSSFTEIAYLDNMLWTYHLKVLGFLPFLRATLLNPRFPLPITENRETSFWNHPDNIARCHSFWLYIYIYLFLTEICTSWGLVLSLMQTAFPRKRAISSLLRKLYVYLLTPLW